MIPIGYDMSTVQGMTEAEEAEYGKARLEFDAAIARRDALDRNSPGRHQAQALVDRASEKMYALDRSYFRLNIWGMSLCRELMYGRGMLSVNGGDSFSQEWPRLEEYGLTDYPDSDERWPKDSAEARFLEAHDKVRDGDSGGMIPAYKLGSNDGWLVTPAEIGRSLEALETCVARGDFEGDPREAKTLDDNGELYTVEWWPRWLDWLAVAKERGGFRVW